MAQDADLPVCRLIRSRVAKLGLSEWDLAHACGYKSVAGGLKAVRSTLESGIIHPFLRPTLPVALGVDQPEFDRAVAETKWMLATRAAEAADRVERRYKDEFCPNIWAQFEHGSPQPNTMTVLGGVYAATYAFCLGLAPIQQRPGIIPVATSCNGTFSNGAPLCRFMG